MITLTITTPTWTLILLAVSVAVLAVGSAWRAINVQRLIGINRERLEISKQRRGNGRG